MVKSCWDLKKVKTLQTDKDIVQGDFNYAILSNDNGGHDCGMGEDVVESFVGIFQSSKKNHRSKSQVWQRKKGQTR